MSLTGNNIDIDNNSRGSSVDVNDETSRQNADFGDPVFATNRMEAGFHFDSVCDNQTAQPLITEQPDAEPTKKRKTDDEGFLTPSTPDIPKTSCHAGPSNSHSGGNLRSYGASDKSACIFGEENPTINLGGRALYCEDGSGDCNPADSLDQLFGNLHKDSKLLVSEWAQIFNESEHFEQICPSRLDRMIEQTNALEDNLRRQKNALCQRLTVLSKTLKML